MTALIRAMRPRQWIKNALVIAAPLAAGVILQPRVLVLTGIALVAFICVSSATYLINDVRDREVDRAHPTKHQRPIATGAVSSRTAVIAAVVLIIIGLGVAAIAGIGLVAVVLGYLAATLAYSFGLKHEPVIELGLLATGFLLRAIAGGVAADLPLSPWFLLVTGFGSLAVAAGKRYSELITLNGDTDTPQRRSLSGYTPTYLRFVWTMAAAVAVTTYCLWVVEVGQPDSTAPWALISVIPFVLAFLRFGVDLDAGRTQAPEDAVLGDPILLVLGLAWVVTFGAGALGI
jgi:decaprenyl-phosphate phosphoribosyltransferase